jgi:hypothetical protein
VSSTVRQRAALIASVALLIWAVVELVSLVQRHTTGPEIYGLMVAALAVVAAAGNLWLLRSTERRTWYLVALGVVWAVIALGGAAGVVAHIVGPTAGHGPVDLRPRPLGAPLVFTAMGAAGALALWLGRRATDQPVHPGRSV